MAVDQISIKDEYAGTEQFLNEVHTEFITKFNSLREEFNGEILRSIASEKEYEKVLRAIFDGLDEEGSKEMFAPGVPPKWVPLKDIFWDFFGKVTDRLPCWFLIQYFSPYHGKRFAYAKKLDKEVEDDGTLRNYDRYLDRWYYRLADDDQDLTGFFNLLLNPWFLREKVKQADHWVARSMIFCKGDEPKEDQTTFGNRMLSLKKLLNSIDSGELDALRNDLINATLSECREQDFGDEFDNIDNLFKSRIECFVNSQIKSKKVIEKIEELRSNIAEALGIDEDEESDRWRPLKKKADDIPLLNTFMLLFLHKPDRWKFYYYFVHQGAPDTSNTALIISTDATIPKAFEICIQEITNVVGAALALVEARAKDAREARRQIAYFRDLNAHSFTKQFTTPLMNETKQLEKTDLRDKASVQRIQLQLERFEFMMQSGQELNTGPVAGYIGDLQKIECEDMINQLKDYAFQRLTMRLNDLYDDPIFRISEPEKRGNLFVSSLPIRIGPSKGKLPVYIWAHRTLLIYHLQSLIQNAIEALDLARAAKRGEPEALVMWYGLSTAGDRIEIGFANTVSNPDRMSERIDGLTSSLKKWQKDLLNSNIQQVTWPDIGTKSGGHSGAGILLAAAYFRSLRSLDSEQNGELRIADAPPKEVSEAFEKALQSEEPVEERFKVNNDFRFAVSISFPYGELVFDKNVINRMPGPMHWWEPPDTRKGQREEQQSSQNIKEIEKSLPDRLQNLIVEDDTADRHRFALNLKQFPLYAPFTFAWNARTQKVWHPEIITKVMKSTNCKLFLDLAWTRYDEYVCDELLSAQDLNEFNSIIKEWGKPSGLELLDRIKKSNLKNHVIVVTAYRSPIMAQYCHRIYGSHIRIFMKWADEKLLLNYLKEGR